MLYTGPAVSGSLALGSQGLSTSERRMCFDLVILVLAIFLLVLLMYLLQVLYFVLALIFLFIAEALRVSAFRFVFAASFYILKDVSSKCDASRMMSGSLVVFLRISLRRIFDHTSTTHKDGFINAEDHAE
mmetsp:Transcript_14151/g.30245  ORF Transcript_14151/g.30245 Transcript_14151/m.30245 type:complete len:130 (-) Transcript_14151:240-629(-)